MLYYLYRVKSTQHLFKGSYFEIHFIYKYVNGRLQKPLYCIVNHRNKTNANVPKTIFWA